MIPKLNFKKMRKSKIIEDFDSEEHNALMRFENLKNRVFLKRRDSLINVKSVKPLCENIISRISIKESAIGKSKIENPRRIPKLTRKLSQANSILDYELSDPDSVKYELSEVIYEFAQKYENSNSAQSFNNEDPGRNLITERSSWDFKIEDLSLFLNLKQLSPSYLPDNPRKINEASFSEVFRCSDSILKIIPFTEFYTVESFLKETFVMKALSNCKGICKIKSSFTVKGKMPQYYIKEWEIFMETRHSENKNLNDYPESQIFGVIIMEDVGIDLENTCVDGFTHLHRILENLLSIIINLEEKFRFEHRDLHWGNIMLKGNSISIIDFNFARLEAEISSDGILDLVTAQNPKLLHTNLNNENWIFEGNSDVDLQFEVYKQMKLSCDSNWEKFNPISNLLWAIYVLDKLFYKISKLSDQKEKYKSVKLIKYLIDISKKCKDCKDLLEYLKSYLKGTN